MNKLFWKFLLALLILTSCQVKDARYYYTEGIRLEGQGEFLRASEAYVALLKLNETHFNALFNLGNLYLLRKQYKLAKQHYIRAILQRTNFAPAYYGLGLSYFGLKDALRGRESMRRASLLDPTLTDAYFQHAWSLYEEQKLSDALKVLDTAVKKNHRNVDCLFNKGWMLHETGDYSNALPLLREATAIASNDMAVSLLLARLLLEKGDDRLARPIVDGIMKKQPEKLTSRLLQARYLAIVKESGKALDKLSKIVQEFPESFQGRMLYAGLLEEAGQTDRALRHYSIAANLDFNNPLPRLRRVALYIKQNKKALAGRELSAMRKQFPRDRRVLVQLLRFYYNRQEYERAIRIATLLLKSDRTNAEAKRIQAFSLFKTDDPSIRDSKQAAALLWSIREQFKKDSFFLKILLKALKENGERRKAREIRRLLKFSLK